MFTIKNRHRILSSLSLACLFYAGVMVGSPTNHWTKYAIAFIIALIPISYLASMMAKASIYDETWFEIDKLNRKLRESYDSTKSLMNDIVEKIEAGGEKNGIDN